MKTKISISLMKMPVLCLIVFTMVFTVSANDYNLSSYSTLSNALSAIGSSESTLRIDRSETISNDISIPANINLNFSRGCVFTIGANATLTINSSIEAGPWQIFAADNAFVKFGSTSPKLEVYPQWWGGKADGTDIRLAAQKAIDSLQDSGGTVKFPCSANYALSTTAYGLKVRSRITLDLDFSTITRIGTEKTYKMIQNYNSSPTAIDSNIVIRNGTLIGTGNTIGVSDQGACLGFYGVDGLIIENITTNNSNGDGIQWRKTDNVYFKNITIGNFGRNGWSPTSGNNIIADTVKIGNPLSGANPGQDIDIEADTPAESGSHWWNNVTAKNVTLVDFYTATNGNFLIQPFYMNNCNIGPGYNALKIISTNRTKSNGIFIGGNNKISTSGASSSAINIDNVSGVFIGSALLDVGTATGYPSGICIANQVDSLFVRGTRFSGFSSDILIYGTAKLNNAEISDSVISSLYLTGANNTFKNCKIKDVVLNGSDTTDNIIGLGSEITGSISLVNSASLNGLHYGNRGLISKAFYSKEVAVPDGITYDLIVDLPDASASGRLLFIVAGYSHKGHSSHWGQLLATVRIGVLGTAQASIINNASSSGVSIAIQSVTTNSITLRLTYSYNGIFSVTILG
jgi:hypothetical protein